MIDQIENYFDCSCVAEERGSRDKTGMCYDLIPPEAIRRLAETIKKGAEHYGKRNWEKGLDINQLIDHAFDHLYKYMAIKLGNTEGLEEEEVHEDHLAHALCNLAFACAIEERFPELGFK